MARGWHNVNRYDVGSGTWTALAPIPVASEAPTCAYNSGANKIYCAEGDTGNSFQIYDIASNSWTTGPSVPGRTNDYGSSSGSFGNKVYIVGGTTGFAADVEVYDIVAGTWSTGIPIPTGFLLAGYQVVGQNLYVVGGFSAGGPNGSGSAATSVLNHQKSAKPKTPSKSSLQGGSGGSGSSGGKEAPDANNTGTYRLDMSTGTWTAGPAFTPARADFGLAYSGGKLYAIGGDATGGGFFDSTNLVDELDVTAWPTGSWTASPPLLPAPNRQANQAGFTSADGTIWSTGGIDGSTFTFLSDHLFRTSGAGGCGTATPTPAITATPTCQAGGGPINVLIAYSDIAGPPNTLVSQIQAERE